eukprot:TRINITY_DN26776_c0_g1_i1.p1 TRINITY_DN26776_c0_g1~~TRINITY_DN26776_c0_g1_i1.p1  ORF type:complete len:571 (-),score=18.08 TRINITY_DN26776_c0_g1_i1:85-1797(-)
MLTTTLVFGFFVGFSTEERLIAGADIESPYVDIEPLPINPALKRKFSPIARTVLKRLERRWRDCWANQWSISFDATFQPNWFVYTPSNQIGLPPTALVTAPICEADHPQCDADFRLLLCNFDEDCPGMGKCAPVSATVKSPSQKPRRLCVGHSDDFYMRMYDVMVQATEFLDIATLSAPNGRFMAAFRNAITYLHNTGRPIIVRVIMSPMYSTANDVLEDFTRDIGRQTRLQIHVSFARIWAWWNHAKILAVDGKILFQGGHNVWDEHYLRRSPVHDVSMEVRGQVAVDAHRFLNHMWTKTCTLRRGFRHAIGVHSVQIETVPSGAGRCPSSYNGAKNAVDLHRTNVPIISLGRNGSVRVEAGQLFEDTAADDAIAAMFRSARKSIKCSMQDIGMQLQVWPKRMMYALVTALMNGAHIYLVLSDSNARPENVAYLDGTYGNGFSITDIRSKLLEYLTKFHHLSEDRVKDMSCRQIHLAYIRYFSGDDRWPLTADQRKEAHERIANHAKLYIVDDSLFYLGSENLYSADLAEYGLIVDDKATTEQVLTQYWDPLWHASADSALREDKARDC